MAFYQKGDVRIAYEEAGKGFPLLIISGGGLNSTIGFIKAGRLRALASTGATRGKALPELPSVAESGYPGFEAIQWYGLVVPGATPKSIVSRIHKDSLKALQNADVRASMERLGLQQESTTPEALVARIKKETATWAAIIKDAGIRLQ